MFCLSTKEFGFSTVLVVRLLFVFRPHELLILHRFEETLPKEITLFPKTTRRLQIVVLVLPDSSYQILLPQHQEGQKDDRE